MATIRTWLERVQLIAPVDEDKAIRREIEFRNMLRLRVFIGVLAIIAGGLALSWYLVNDQWGQFPHYRMYFWIDVAIFATLPLFCLALYRRWPASEKDITRFHELFLNFFGLLVLCWLAVSSGYEHFSTGNVTHYIIGVFALAAVFYYQGPALLVLYMLSLGLFFWIVWHLEPGEIHIFRRYDNLIILVPLAWISSRALYAAFARNLHNRRHLAAVNRQLEQEITERRHAEAELRASEQRLSLHFKQTPLGVIEWDLDWRVTAWNPAAEKIFGYSAREAMGRKAADLILTTDKRDHVDAVWQDLLKQRGGRRSDNTNVHKDGRLLECEWYNTALVAPDGKVIGVSSLVLDATARKRMEKEKKALEQHLARSQKLEALGQLAGGIAHDFNNLLSIIMGNVDLARMDVPESGASAPLLDKAMENCRKAHRLTRKFLTFATGGSPNKQSLALEKVVRQAAAQAIIGSTVSCRFETDESLWPLSADENQIRQVIHDLVRNAVQSEPADGLVTVRVANCQIDARNEGGLPLAPGRYIQVAVCDNGRGIAETDLAYVFDPYFSTKSLGTQKGMGMGLTVALSVIEKHGGHIGITSAPDRGTTVTFYLPAGDAPRP